MGEIHVPVPFSWIPYWDRKRVLFATTITESVWRVEASRPIYRHHAFYDDAWNLFGLEFYFEEFRDMAGDFLRKAVDSQLQSENAVHFRDERLEKEFPALYDYLACAIGPNGKAREGACLIVYGRDGEVTACLKDRGLKRAFYGRSDGLWDALRELEARLKG